MPSYDMTHIMVVEELYLEVLNAMDMIDTNISDGDLLSFFIWGLKGRRNL
jgi:hypothetical protein